MQLIHTGAIAGRVTLALALAAGLFACPPDPRDNVRSDIVAKVGDEQIDRRTFLSALSTAGTARIEAPADRERQARAVLDRLIEEALLHQGAKAAGISVTDEEVVRDIRKSSDGYPPGEFRRTLRAEQITFQDFRDRVKRRLTIDAYLKQALAARKKVDPALVQARYQATVASHPHRVEVRVRQVLVKTDEEAAYLRSEIRKRRLRLEEAARRYSVAPEAQSGGDLGWFTQGQLPEIFDICFSLKPGEVSEVVSSDYGYHIFELIARRASKEPPSLDDSRAALTRDIVREQEAKGKAALLDKLRQTYPSQIDPVVFKEVVAVLPPAPKADPEKDAAKGRAWSTYNSGSQGVPSSAEKQATAESGAPAQPTEGANP